MDDIKSTSHNKIYIMTITTTTTITKYYTKNAFSSYTRPVTQTHIHREKPITIRVYLYKLNIRIVTMNPLMHTHKCMRIHACACVGIFKYMCEIVGLVIHMFVQKVGLFTLSLCDLHTHTQTLTWKYCINISVFYPRHYCTNDWMHESLQGEGFLMQILSV